MDIYSIIGIALIILVIVICVKKRKKKRKKSDRSEIDKTADKGGTPEKVTVPVRKGPTPNVIYVFPGNSRKANCPYCDGENDVNAVTCAICGERIASRKR